MSRDDQILATLCDLRPWPSRMIRVNVDDLVDPHEVELSHEEIHLTIVGTGGPEEPLFCLALSCESAGMLARELADSIRKRTPGSGGGR